MKAQTEDKIYRILLLTNINSDNVGDQVIEACDVSIIETVMKNLNIDRYEIDSQPAGILPKKFLQTKNEDLIIETKKIIRKADVVLFGGAPMFNYLYQVFAARTTAIINIAKEYNIPVLFSAIGIESYHENNKNCINLKKALNYNCVKVITTRDNFDLLKKYKNNKELIIDKVSDPAVFSNVVFRNVEPASAPGEKKKIGIFIIRGNAFKDNNIDVTAKQVSELLKDLITNLENRGYDYEFLTSGHFTDDAYIDRMIRSYGFSQEKCVLNVCTPEQLVSRIKSYDGVVSTRLHPSIISYSLDVPSIGVVWNPKVPGFYESIGYGDRALNIRELNGEKIVDNLEIAMKNGIKKDKDYLSSVYKGLFNGIKIAFNISEDIAIYDYDELVDNIPVYGGTTREMEEEKIIRKFRRTYGTLNRLKDNVTKNKPYTTTIAQLEAQVKELQEYKRVNELKFGKKVKRKIKRIIKR